MYLAEGRYIGVAVGRDFAGVPLGQQRQLPAGGAIELGFVGFAQPLQVHHQWCAVAIGYPILLHQIGSARGRIDARELTPWLFTGSCTLTHRTLLSAMC